GSLYDLLTPLQVLRQAISKVTCDINPYFSLIPAYSNLAALEEEMMMIPDREQRLKQLLVHPEILNGNWDFIVLDCPPNLGLLSWNALEAADEIIIPVEPSFFSLHGLAKISETV